MPIISNLLQFHAEELHERNHPPTPFCLILSPTRELAIQTEREARKFAFGTPVKPRMLQKDVCFFYIIVIY